MVYLTKHKNRMCPWNISCVYMSGWFDSLSLHKLQPDPTKIKHTLTWHNGNCNYCLFKPIRSTIFFFLSVPNLCICARIFVWLFLSRNSKFYEYIFKSLFVFLRLVWLQRRSLAATRIYFHTSFSSYQVVHVKPCFLQS